MEVPQPDADLSTIASISLEESLSQLKIPIVANHVLIKGCKVTIEGCTGSADHSVCNDSITYQSQWSMNKLIQVAVPDNSDAESISLDSLSDMSSDEDVMSYQEPSVHFPATLRLLKEISLRILGEEDPNIPTITKVEHLHEHKSIESPEQKSTLKIITDYVEEKTVGEWEVEGEKEQKQEEVTATDRYSYMDIVRYAEHFVDDILFTAKKVCMEEHDKNISTVTFDEKCYGDEFWPTIENFTIDCGLKWIDTYIEHEFDLKEQWKYKIRFLGGQSDEPSDFYLYEVIFCIPTTCYPVAQVTVSLYFTFEVSRVIPKHQTVKVTFTLESLRSVMTPGKVKIKDENLLQVLYAKLAVYRDVIGF